MSGKTFSSLMWFSISKQLLYSKCWVGVGSKDRGRTQVAFVLGVVQGGDGPRCVISPSAPETEQAAIESDT